MPPPFRSVGGLALLGAAVLGALFESGAGLLAGALIGAVWGTVNALASRIADLEQELRQVARHAQRLEEQLRRLEEPARRATPDHPATTSQTASTNIAVPPAPVPAVPPALARLPLASRPPRPPQEEAMHATSGGVPVRPGVAAGAAAPVPNAVVAAVIAFCTTGNLVAKVGVLILFVGVAFLVRFAADRGLLPIEYRLMGVSIAAMAALAFGWRLRRTRSDYAIVVQGGAVGVLYLTIFAAFRLYSLMPAGAALGLMLSVVALSGALAVLQNQVTLAVLGTSGGFLAPLLASTGQGSHVALFSYYLALNVGVLGLAWFRAWRALNWLGFVFTFGVGLVWGGQYYQPALFSTTEPFLVAFFLFYVAVSVLFGRRQPPELRGYIDGSLVFGLPAVAFAMQSVLVGDIEFGRAYSALVLSAFYLALSRVLGRRTPTHAPLAEAFLALGVVFLTLTIPLAFDGHAVAAGWALEGAALVWVGFRQQRLLARSAGAVLTVAAGFGFLIISSDSHSTLAVLNTRFLGGAAVAAGALMAAHQYFAHRSKLRKWEWPVEGVLLTWGLLWWLGVGLHESDRFLRGARLLTSCSLGLSLSALVAAAASRRLRWPGLGWAPMALVPLTVVLVSETYALSFFDGARTGPWTDGGWAAWPVFIVASGTILSWFESQWPTVVTRAAQAATAWIGVFLAAWAAASIMATVVPEGPTWARVMWAVVPAGAAFALASHGDRLPWSVKRWPSWFRTTVAGVPLAAAVVWCVLALASPGSPAPLPYVPLLNPLELAQAFSLLALVMWSRKIDRESAMGEALAARTGWLAMGLGFLCVNAAVARGVHRFAAVPYEWESLTVSPILQASLSVLWAVTSLGLMSMASRRAQRPTWIVGASLLAVLVVKLFTVDFGGIGTVARIVSFLATGLLIMVIGYFSPAPPRREDA